jgi:flagellar hook-associated protein 2
MISIDGIITGLDTTSIVARLMDVERLPVTRLEAQQAKDDTKIAAWKAISTALDKVRSTSAAISTRYGLSASSATSSSPSTVTVSASPTAATGTLRFRVAQLATSEQRISAASVGDGSAPAGAGRLAAGVGLASLAVTALAPDADATAGAYTIEVTAGTGGNYEIAVTGPSGEEESTTVDGSATTASVAGLTFSFAAGSLTTGSARAVVAAANASTTIADLASSLGATGSPVSARLISLGASGTSSAGADNRIVLTAQDTGAASTLTVGYSGLSDDAVDAFTATTVVAAAQDAIVRIGTPGSDVAIQRATNTIDDVVDGVTLDLLQAAPDTDVTVQVSRDVEGLAAKITAWVDAVNGALTAIDSRSSYDADAKTAGPLLSESAARTLRDTLTQSLTGATGTGSTRLLSQMGVAIAASGRFTVDATALRTALTSDPDGVTALLTRQGTATDGGVAFEAATAATVPGTYDVVVTQLADQAAVTGTAFGSLGADETIWVRVGSTEVSYAATAGSTPDEVAAGLAAAFAAAGVAAGAGVVGGAVRVHTTAYGSSATLGIRTSVDGSTTGSTGFGGADPDVYADHTGVDVAGTIGGVTAEGSGRYLTAAGGAAAGLRLRISAGAPGALGTVTYANGAAGASNTALGADGLATTLVDNAAASAKAHRRQLQDRIDGHEARLVLTEARYRKQFTALEAVLSQLKSQGSTLTSLIAGLPTNRTSDS